MAANLLNSKRAVEVSVFVIRAFVRLRELIANHKELARKLAELERRVLTHDGTLRELVVAIRKLMNQPSEPPREKFGFARVRKD